MAPPPPDQTMLLSLLGAGFATAFLHAALPTHWLPFALVGRAQRWPVERILAAVVVAGLAHVAVTAAVGSLIVVAGLALDQWIGGLLPYLSAALLFTFGGFYLIRSLVRGPRLVEGPPLEVGGPAVSHAAAFWALVATMVVSPGEVLLPFYLNQAHGGVAVLAALTVVFALGTVLGMALFTLLARAGWSVLRLERWARYEGVVLGLALIAIGLLVVLYHP
ncbi:MAG: hypothetical protein KL785_08960 [Brevundimonas sp.]|nr:hypothetical protein [Brevundimonas sp.]